MTGFFNHIRKRKAIDFGPISMQMATTALNSLPPFINDEFVLIVLSSLDGRATLMDMRIYVKTHYSGWTENTMLYFASQAANLIERLSGKDQDWPSTPQKPASLLHP